MLASIGIFITEDDQHGPENDPQIQPDRPVIDVVEVVFYPLLDFFLGIRLAAPTVHLCPARDTGFNPVARGIIGDDILEKFALGAGFDRARLWEPDHPVTPRRPLDRGHRRRVPRHRGGRSRAFREL